VVIIPVIRRNDRFEFYYGYGSISFNTFFIRGNKQLKFEDLAQEPERILVVEVHNKYVMVPGV